MIYKSNTGVEITNNLGFGFIKFGFESIKWNFEADLRRYGLEVMRAASIVMDPAVVNFIYRDSRESFLSINVSASYNNCRCGNGSRGRR